jgi:hypothetical protein
VLPAGVQKAWQTPSKQVRPAAQSVLAVHSAPSPTDPALVHVALVPTMSHFWPGPQPHCGSTEHVSPDGIVHEPLDEPLELPLDEPDEPPLEPLEEPEEPPPPLDEPLDPPDEPPPLDPLDDPLDPPPDEPEPLPDDPLDPPSFKVGRSVIPMSALQASTDASATAPAPKSATCCRLLDPCAAIRTASGRGKQSRRDPRR